MLAELARITPTMAANWFRRCGYTAEAQ